MLLTALLCLLGFEVSFGFNVDPNFPLLLTGPLRSYFGYTVAFYRSPEGEISALVGAIRANSSLENWKDIYQPGVLYKCPLQDSGGRCSDVVVERRGQDRRQYGDQEMRYFDLKDNMTLGMTLVSQPGGRTVVCGPLWRNQHWGNSHLPNGVCYVLNSSLQLERKLLPFIRHSLQVVGKEQSYYYYSAECGLSAAFASDGHIIFGAPGLSNWKGAVIQYLPSLRSWAPDLDDVPSWKTEEEDSYIGYSVASGRFYKEDPVTVAAGAPRGNQYKGEVILYASDTETEKARLYGQQMGEYFGASLLAIRVDQQGTAYDNLLVGAPQFTRPGGMDEGRVYGYRSYENGLTLDVIIEGSMTRQSRFGTSIANIGDINMDGYNDVAVGAPFEDGTGAVYIYHGARQSTFRKDYAQRILASQITSKTGALLSGFGISISKGYDVDNNHYNDILVGAFQSDSAVLLRTRPVIEVRASITTSTSVISNQMEKCRTLDGRILPCFTVNACLHYGEPLASTDLAFRSKLIIDDRRATEQRNVRGFLYIGSTSVYNITTEIRPNPSRNTCFTKKVYLHSLLVDQQTPFDVRLSFKLINRSHDKWCPSCPVLNPDLPLTTTETIPFKQECREQDVCRCDLKLDVMVTQSKKQNLFVVGEQTPVILIVQVHNKNFADPAYMARAIINVPPSVRIINKGSCSVVQNDLSNFTRIVCDAGNPLRPEMTETFYLKLDVSHVLKTITLNVAATTTSEDIDPKNNVFSRVLSFVYEADVTISGIAKPAVVDYGARTQRILMEHNLIITKQFASPINAVELTLHVPQTFNESATPFIMVKNIKVKSGDAFVSGTCRPVHGYFRWTEASATEAEDPSPSSSTSASPSRVYRSMDTANSTDIEESAFLMEELSRINYYNVVPLNCITSFCLEIKCTLGPFLPMRARVALVTVTLLFDMPEFTKQAGIWYAFAVGTEGRINILDDVPFVHDGNGRKEASAITVLQKQGNPPAKPVPLWIIGGSTAAGLVTLSVLFAALIHVGFFRRHHLEKMERMVLKDQEEVWDAFMVTEEDIEEEKKFFRNSMMLGVTNGRLHFTDNCSHGAECLDDKSCVHKSSAQTTNT